MRKRGEILSRRHAEEVRRLRVPETVYVSPIQGKEGEHYREVLQFASPEDATHIAFGLDTDLEVPGLRKKALRWKIVDRDEVSAELLNVLLRNEGTDEERKLSMKGGRVYSAGGTDITNTVRFIERRKYPESGIDESAAGRSLYNGFEDKETFFVTGGRDRHASERFDDEI